VPELSERMEFAAELAKAAGALALRHFQTKLVIEVKADRSPVTIADRECERLIRERGGRRRDGHRSLGSRSRSS